MIIQPSALICLHCSTTLEAGQAALQCPKCAHQWPVRSGIPRFFESARYWGELPHEQAEKLLEEAARAGWRQAVLRRFAGDADFQTSLLDLRRASWLPLLGLDSASVALDIGSGYGALTHALAGVAGQVYSLEAVPQRIEFTRVRLEQEQITNVQLLQATALELPLRDETFDLIVVNGVLEWIGDWAPEGDPADAQARFLRVLAAKLRPGGLLLVGIENRTGLQYFRGGRDHSGLAYTSLMPRALASWYLRWRLRDHHRSEVNPGRGYRTYTYTEFGYRRLLARSGFPVSQFYWANPGYNQPYSLVPLQAALMREHFEDNLSDPAFAFRWNWKDSLKRMLVRLGPIRWVPPDFVILAGRSGPDCARRLLAALRPGLSSLPQLLAPVWLLDSRSFGQKGILRLFEAGQAAPKAVLRTAVVGSPGMGLLERHEKALVEVNRVADQLSHAGVALPRAEGSTRIGNIHYFQESVAAGLPVSRLIFRARRSERGALIRREMPRLLDAAVGLALALCGATWVEPTSPGFWQLPPELIDQRGFADLAERLRTQWKTKTAAAGWVQHGDFTIENCFLDPATNQITLIDWEQMVSGVPPLYDVFALTLSALSSIPGRAVPAGRDPWLWRFEEVFFGEDEWGADFREWVLRAARSLAIPEQDIWPMFLQFLVLRYNFYRKRKTGIWQHYVWFLRLAASHTPRILPAG